MGQYFSPPNELTAIGRQLSPGSYHELRSQVSPSINKGKSGQPPLSQSCSTMEYSCCYGEDLKYTEIFGTPEEELFGLYDRGDSLVAPRLSSIQEFNHYSSQYRRKKAISRTFWAVLKSTIVLNSSFYKQRAPH